MEYQPKVFDKRRMALPMMLADMHKESEKIPSTFLARCIYTKYVYYILLIKETLKTEVLYLLEFGCLLLLPSSDPVLIMASWSSHVENPLKWNGGPNALVGGAAGSGWPSKDSFDDVYFPAW